MISRTLCVCVCAMLVRISSQSDLAPQVYVRVCLCAFMCACVVSSTAGAGVKEGGQQNVEEGARGLRVQAAA